MKNCQSNTKNTHSLAITHWNTNTRTGCHSSSCSRRGDRSLRMRHRSTRLSSNGRQHRFSSLGSLGLLRNLVLGEFQKLLRILGSNGGLLYCLAFIFESLHSSFSFADALGGENALSGSGRSSLVSIGCLSRLDHSFRRHNFA